MKLAFVALLSFIHWLIVWPFSQVLTEADWATRRMARLAFVSRGRPCELKVSFMAVYIASISTAAQASVFSIGSSCIVESTWAASAMRGISKAVKMRSLTQMSPDCMYCSKASSCRAFFTSRPAPLTPSTASSASWLCWAIASAALACCSAPAASFALSPSLAAFWAAPAASFACAAAFPAAACACAANGLAASWAAKAAF
mmetsp:Transcript_12450/g.27076  ORF Transcript_12450/g.27076 Transcript_12450/m.27076 type:complete len:201 (+) Transcript_12450:349-951(+)